MKTKLTNYAKRIWANDTFQKAYRAFVTVLLSYALLAMGDVMGLLSLIAETGDLDAIKNIDFSAVGAFLISTIAAAVRAALAAIVPAVKSSFSKFSKG